jgi:ClpP class serine protease
MSIDMSNKPEENKDRLPQKIDEIIDEAVENAEARRELSNEELDEVAGGLKISGITIGLIAQNNNS